MSNPEDEYFAKLDREKMDKLKAKLEQERTVASRDEERRIHFHRCGKCGAQMETKSFRGVEIEICPACGAVLLDPGELEQLAGADRSGFWTGVRDLFSGSTPE